MGVSILLVLEIGLDATMGIISSLGCTPVSILLVLEIGLDENIVTVHTADGARFNPSCAGNWLRRFDIIATKQHLNGFQSFLCWKLA